MVDEREFELDRFDVVQRARALHHTGLFDDWSMLGIWSQVHHTALAVRRGEETSMVCYWPHNESADGFASNFRRGMVRTEPLTGGPWERSPIEEPERHGFLALSLLESPHNFSEWGQYRGPTWAETMAMWVAVLGGMWHNPTLGVWVSAPDEIVFCQALWGYYVGGYEGDDPWGNGSPWLVMVHRLGSYGTLANPWTVNWAAEAIRDLNEFSPGAYAEAMRHTPQHQSSHGFYGPIGDPLPEPMAKICADLAALVNRT